MADDKIRLNPEELDKVSGGYLFDADEGWEVIDDRTGDVIAGGLSEDEAVNLCFKLGIDYDEIDWDELNDLRQK